jgi:hypothetical protein
MDNLDPNNLGTRKQKTYYLNSMGIIGSSEANKLVTHAETVVRFSRKKKQLLEDNINQK